MFRRLRLVAETTGYVRELVWLGLFVVAAFVVIVGFVRSVARLPGWWLGAFVAAACVLVVVAALLVRAVRNAGKLKFVVPGGQVHWSTVPGGTHFIGDITATNNSDAVVRPQTMRLLDIEQDGKREDRSRVIPMAQFENHRLVAPGDVGAGCSVTLRIDWTEPASTETPPGDGPIVARLEIADQNDRRHPLVLTFTGR